MKYTLGVLLVACSAVDGPQPATSPKFDVVLVATRDGSLPVEGARILEGRKLLGTSDGNGVARLRLQGEDGDSVALSVECPSGFASPDEPLVVGLRVLAEGSPAPRFGTRCSPRAHSVVVGLRAENGGNLPILHLKKVIGHTDDHGMAHVLLEAPANESIALTLDTSAEPGLRPQSPSLTFLSEARDELVLLEQKFTVPKAPPKPQLRVSRPERL